MATGQAAASRPADDVRTRNPRDLRPSRASGCSPKFCALMCWLLHVEPMTTPAIVDLCVTQDCVWLATTEDPFFNHLLGRVQDAERNVRTWAETCNAHPALTETLLSKLRKHVA